MKKIEAIIRKSRFEDVKQALLAADIEWFSYYDVRGIGGIIGSILTGVFATRTVTGANGVEGALYGDWHQLGIQIITTLISIVFSAVVTYILYVLVDNTIGMRVCRRVEEEGLDIYEHGESAYN